MRKIVYRAQQVCVERHRRRRRLLVLCVYSRPCTTSIWKGAAQEPDYVCVDALRLLRSTGYGLRIRADRSVVVPCGLGATRFSVC